MICPKVQTGNISHIYDFNLSDVYREDLELRNFMYFNLYGAQWYVYSYNVLLLLLIFLYAGMP